ncbi:hypothetical protein D3C76_1495850 [compost metagenome]
MESLSAVKLEINPSMAVTKLAVRRSVLIAAAPIMSQLLRYIFLLSESISNKLLPSVIINFLNLAVPSIAILATASSKFSDPAQKPTEGSSFIMPVGVPSLRVIVDASICPLSNSEL